ncbi:unnamed protein product [Medioppia subpectinata]|uniref:ABC transporter domain-containing protein n=1 Tax=Medioppia subpectinata TaxID=1979941 RepID=A0A7R9KBT4_9ACAR|nr:unnamed protein product [Medioppia subpectinata]CAG2100302.1 unnamed protein product [Medioppia subpectinata]
MHWYNSHLFFWSKFVCDSMLIIGYASIYAFILQYYINILGENDRGCVHVNTLNALMGPSGAGKTTLLKRLNGQNSVGLSANTKIYAINDRWVRPCFIKSEVWDHLLPGLTVRQTLVYASRLKNSRICVELNHNKIVTDLMSELAIGDTADNRVETCSGGEQKRIPNMLCIDEPTSGLDSNAVEVVINCLKILSRRHEMTIIASIHQPNNDIFNMFDNIYVLAKGGVCLYSGVPHRLRQHLTDNGIECQENQVPIEVLMKMGSTPKSQSRDTTDTTMYINGVNCDTNALSTMRPVLGSLSLAKRFSFTDIYHSLCYSLTHTLRCQWVLILAQFVALQTFALVMVYSVSPDIIVPDGCVELAFGADCTQTVAELRDETLINQNIKLQVCLIISMAFVVLVMMSATFGQDFRSVAQLSAMVFIDEPKVTAIFALIIQIGVQMLGNNQIPVRELHYTLQWLSQLSYIGMSFECIMIYGFGRCQGNQIPGVLYAMAIDDDKFWPNTLRLAVVCAVLKILTN